MTPYAVIRDLNKEFGTNYPTQMGYNYARQGLIPATKVDGAWYVDPEDAAAWIAKFAAKNLSAS
jgi:hypothetical protein